MTSYRIEAVLLSLLALLSPFHTFAFRPVATRGTVSTRGTTLPPLYSTVAPESTQTPQSVPSPHGGIAMTVGELTQALHISSTDAQRLWDCYSIGMDPSHFYAPEMHLGYDDFESILERLPRTTTTRSPATPLPPKVLPRLAALYGSCQRVEGGVATLSYITPGRHATKMRLKLADGALVETTVTSTGGVSMATNSRGIGK